MSTLPPNGHHHREELMRASQANMAVAQPTKTKSASKATNNASSKQKAQMHRRSRTGLCRFPHVLYSSLLVLLDLYRCRLRSHSGLPYRSPVPPFVFSLQLRLKLFAIAPRTQWLT